MIFSKEMERDIEKILCESNHDDDCERKEKSCLQCRIIQLEKIKQMYITKAIEIGETIIDNIE